MWRSHWATTVRVLSRPCSASSSDRPPVSSLRSIDYVSRTSRLFLLLDALRGHRRPVTATQLAESLSVSLRTIYRDIGTLIELGAPIDGAAGVGYVLRTGFFLPPLMFDEDELEALVLGAGGLSTRGTPGLHARLRRRSRRLQRPHHGTCATDSRTRVCGLLCSRRPARWCCRCSRSGKRSGTSTRSGSLM